MSFMTQQNNLINFTFDEVSLEAVSNINECMVKILLFGRLFG